MIPVAAEKIDHVESSYAYSSTGFGLSRLEKAVDALQGAVGNLALKPAQHSAPIVHEGVGDFEQRR